MNILTHRFASLTLGIILSISSLFADLTPEEKAWADAQPKHSESSSMTAQTSLDDVLGRLECVDKSTYYVDREGNKVWHGPGTITGKSTERYMGIPFNRTYNASYTYKYGQLDGPVTISLNENATGGGERYLIKWDLTAKFKNGVPVGTWTYNVTISYNIKGMGKANDSGTSTLVFNNDGKVTSFNTPGSGRHSFDANGHFVGNVNLGNKVGIIANGICTNLYYNENGNITAMDDDARDACEEYKRNGETNLAGFGYTVQRYYEGNLDDWDGFIEISRLEYLTTNFRNNWLHGGDYVILRAVPTLNYSEAKTIVDNTVAQHLHAPVKDTKNADYQTSRAYYLSQLLSDLNALQNKLDSTGMMTYSYNDMAVKRADKAQVLAYIEGLKTSIPAAWDKEDANLRATNSTKMLDQMAATGLNNKNVRNLPVSLQAFCPMVCYNVVEDKGHQLVVDFIKVDSKKENKLYRYTFDLDRQYNLASSSANFANAQENTTNAQLRQKLADGLLTINTNGKPYADVTKAYKAVYDGINSNMLYASINDYHAVTNDLNTALEMQDMYTRFIASRKRLEEGCATIEEKAVKPYDDIAANYKAHFSSFDNSVHFTDQASFNKQMAEIDSELSLQQMYIQFVDVRRSLEEGMDAINAKAVKPYADIADSYKTIYNKMDKTVHFTDQASFNKQKDEINEALKLQQMFLQFVDTRKQLDEGFDAINTKAVKPYADVAKSYKAQFSAINTTASFTDQASFNQVMATMNEALKVQQECLHFVDLRIEVTQLEDAIQATIKEKKLRARNSEFKTIKAGNDLTWKTDATSSNACDGIKKAIADLKAFQATL